ncbi:putative reverse transcriptase domain-containing protein, partial [Tanacetum coccineum]
NAAKNDDTKCCRGNCHDEEEGRVDVLAEEVVELEVDMVIWEMVGLMVKNLLPTILAQVGDQGSNLGNGRNQNGDTINDNIRGDVRNVIENNDRRGCTYNDFLACNPKDYDGKGGSIVYTRWIEKMESVQDMSGCRDNQKIHTRSLESAVSMLWEDFKTLTKEEFCPSNEMQKLETELWNHPMVGASHAAYTDRFHELARLIAGTLTDEAIRNGSIKKNLEKKGNIKEPSKNRNGRDDNKRTRTGYVFATVTNLVRRENMGHLAKDCRVVPRNMNPVNDRNPAAARGACFEYGGTDHYKSACPRAFMLGAEEARQDSNIITGTFTLNNHYTTTLFDSGAYNSFVPTTFIPLLGIEPSDLGFSYKIEIASGQLVEIDKVIKGCKLEINGHVFDINLIPFGSRSFDVIIGMD